VRRRHFRDISSKRLIVNCGGDSRSKIVSMVQATNSRHRDDVAAGVRTLDGLTTRRSLLVQAEMGSVLVKVSNILAHQPFEMPSVEHDHVVEEIATAASDEALGDAVLPRALERSPDRFHAKRLCRFDDFGIEGCVAVVDQVFRSRVERERLAQLLRNPGARRMPGDIEVENPSPVVSDNEEAIEHAEGKGRHGEEVHRGNRRVATISESRLFTAGAPGPSHSGTGDNG